jgi:hypothetical protein
MLVNHLISISPGNRESVWKANLRIVAGLISIWGPSLSIRKMDLLHMLNKKDEASLSFLSPGDRIVATALAVFAMLLTSGLPALNLISDTDIPPDKCVVIQPLPCKECAVVTDAFLSHALPQVLRHVCQGSHP